MSDLASPSGAPKPVAKSVVVYDGACGFCRKQVARIARWDRAGVFEFLARQTPGLEERFPRLADADFNTGLRLILPDGTILVGADGVYEIARRLPRFRALAWLYRVPLLHGFCKSLYAWVARNRYRLVNSCDDGACSVPPR